MAAPATAKAPNDAIEVAIVLPIPLRAPVAALPNPANLPLVSKVAVPKSRKPKEVAPVVAKDCCSNAVIAEPASARLLLTGVTSIVTGSSLGVLAPSLSTELRTSPKGELLF